MKGGLGLHFLHVFIQSFIYIFGIFLAKTKEKTGPQHFLYISYLATLGFYSLRILEIISFFTPSSKLYFSFPLPSSQRHHRLTYGLNPQNKVSCCHWCNNRQRHCQSFYHQNEIPILAVGLRQFYEWFVQPLWKGNFQP